MSKAEQRALEAYPPKMRYVGIDSVKYDRKIDVNKPMRDRYVKAYHQAEKDFELTWEDIPEIFRISERLKTNWWFIDNEQTKQIGTQVFWEEVLRRFKEKKSKLI